MTPPINKVRDQRRLNPLKVLSHKSLLDSEPVVAPEGLVNDRLKVHEIYTSIQGESSYAGLPCVFVRTTACNLRCRYCDTAHAFVKGEERSVDDVFQEAHAPGIKLVEITGGEPLLQPGTLVLMQKLLNADHDVLLETSGSLDISSVDPRVVRIVDFKTPDSGEENANHWNNVNALRTRDEVKFVLLSKRDYDWAKRVIERYSLTERCSVLMGVAFEHMPVHSLVEWVLEDNLPVRVQLQMHKFIWAADTHGV